MIDFSIDIDISGFLIIVIGSIDQKLEEIEFVDLKRRFCIENYILPNSSEMVLRMFIAAKPYFTQRVFQL